MRFIKVTELDVQVYGGTWVANTVFINPEHIQHVEGANNDQLPAAKTYISLVDCTDFYVLETIEQVMMEIEQCNSK